MNIARNALAALIAAVILGAGAVPATSGDHAAVTEYSAGNFYGTARLDTTQVVDGGSSPDMWVCFPEGDDFDCHHAATLTHRDFIGFREGEPKLIPAESLYTN